MRVSFLAIFIVLLFIAIPFSGVGAGEVVSAPNVFSWSTTAALGDTAARVTVTLLEPSLCSWHSAMAGAQGVRGGTFLFESLANESAGRFSGVRASSAKSTHAHVGDDVDARAPVRVAETVTLLPTGRWASQSWTNATAPMAPDTYTWTLGGLGLAPTQTDPGRLGYWSLKVELTCDAPFTVDSFGGSHELMLWTAGSMRGGVGASESLVVGAEIGNHIERTFTTPVVQNELWFKRYNEVGQAGTLVRTTPDSTTTWDLLAETEVSLYDATGPGLHRYDLDRVALDFFSTLSGASYGIGPVGTLDELVPS